MRVGYCRVSSRDQNEARQLDAFENLELDRIYVDKKSGKNFERVEYQKMRDYVREGDVLYIESLDRFGRNKAEILSEWHYLTVDKSVDIVVLDMPLLDTTRFKELDGLQNLIRDIVLQILSWLAEDERKRINQRQREGIDAALKRGVKLGRKPIKMPASFPEFYRRWKAGEITATAAMQEMRLKRTTFYKMVREFEAGEASEALKGRKG